MLRDQKSSDFIGQDHSLTTEYGVTQSEGGKGEGASIHNIKKGIPRNPRIPRKPVLVGGMLGGVGRCWGLRQKVKIYDFVGNE